MGNFASALANSTNSLFVGTDTAPARVVKVSGFLTPVDCAMSDWGEWSTCSKTCAGGEQTRTRTVTQEMLHGGSPCPSASDDRSCNSAIVCPVECSGGRVWTTQGTLPAKTCSDSDPQIMQSNLQHCQCPPVSAPSRSPLNPQPTGSPVTLRLVSLSSPVRAEQSS